MWWKRKKADDSIDILDRLLETPRKYDFFNCRVIELTLEDERVNASVTEFAPLCAGDPKTETGDVSFAFEKPSHHSFSILYIAPSRRSLPGIVRDFDAWRLSFQGWNWRLTDTTMVELRKAGLKKNGRSATIHPGEKGRWERHVPNAKLLRRLAIYQNFHIVTNRLIY
ncbi:hypothetical protein F5X98DRAFT_371174 [Xylaria grammica]|nr:hypothetical protein F5X98DRAFT_371174 [Xylaria grammica]